MDVIVELLVGTKTEEGMGDVTVSDTTRVKIIESVEWYTEVQVTANQVREQQTLDLMISSMTNQKDKRKFGR